MDVAELILARSDAEDVFRWKSVCKSWYKLISSNYFVKAHLKRSYNNNREHGYLRIRLHSSFNNNVDKNNLCNFMIVGSCNGLVCISITRNYLPNELLVTNPSTREVKKLAMHRRRACWGFGYDSLIDDYKVVVGLDEFVYHLRFLVLCLKSDKWKFVGAGDYLTYKTSADTNNLVCGFLYDGALHWFVYNTEKKKTVILSFDLTLEKFKEIALPNDTKYVWDNRDILGMFEECLCIFRSNDIHDSYCQKIWVMKNDNCWERVPRDYEGIKYGAATTAYKLDCFPDNTWYLCDDDKGNVDLSCQSWSNVGAPIFVKSLVSPLSKKIELSSKSGF